MLPKRLKYLLCERVDFGFSSIQKSYYNQQIIAGSIGLATGIACLAIKTRAANNEQINQSAVNTSQLLAAYQSAAQNEISCQTDLDNINAEIEKYNQLNSSDKIKTKQDGIAKELSDLETANKPTDETNSSLSQYNTAVSNLNNLKTVQQNVAKAKQAAADADSDVETKTAEFNSTPSSFTTKHGTTRQTISFTDTEPGLDGSQYSEEAHSKFKSEDEQALKEAWNKWKNAKGAKEAAEATAKAKNSEVAIELAKAGESVKTEADLQNEITKAENEVKSAGAKKMNESDGSYSVSTYLEKKAELESQQKEASELTEESVKKKLEELKTKKQEAETKLKEAKAEKAKAEANLSGLTNAVNAATGADAKLAEETADYANAKTLNGKNGKKRNWWQRLWGTNKSATLKAAKKDYKAAKKAEKATNKALLYNYGVTVNYTDKTS